MADRAVVCLSCGCPPDTGFNYCGNCAAARSPLASVCLNCGVALRPQGSAQRTGAGDKSKVAAGLFALFLGAFGVHKFYLGYTGEGVLAIVLFWIVGLITLGIGMLVMGVIFLIEGIIYLTKSDEEFQRIYVDAKKGWF